MQEKLIVSDQGFYSRWNVEELYICTVIVHLYLDINNRSKFRENLIKLILIKQVVDFFISLICCRINFFISAVIVFVCWNFDLQLDIKLWHTLKLCEKLIICIRIEAVLPNNRLAHRVLLIVETHLRKIRLIGFKLFCNNKVTHLARITYKTFLRTTNVFLRICLVF